VKIAVSWLREWVNPKFDAVELAHRLTMAGLEVDSLAVDGEGIDSVRVAEVIDVAPHPDADRLSVCRVQTGSGEPVTVVCGAPNVRPGLKTPYAAPGVQLPDGTSLAAATIRGVQSNGMLCSAAELGLGADADGIMELPVDAKPGQPLADLLSVPDQILDIDITPNRGDCFSVLGIARDVAALSERPLKGPDMHVLRAATKTVHPVDRPEPEACPRFAHRVVEGIDPDARTPLWMTERLRKSGLRPISPVVDVTNYVMLELGQPLHAYDRDRLEGPVRPRYARTGERVTLLDGRDVELQSDTVVITDDSGVIGMAGIMGGLGTMVTERTRNVFFEGAFWPTSVMAGRARSYGLHTDASVRFERGVDPAGQARAVERAVELLVGIAGGKPGPLVDDYDEDLMPTRESICLTAGRLNQVLGSEISTHAVTDILVGLGLEIEEADVGWNVIPPSYRFDIAMEDDLVEEVARIYGYDRIPESTAIAATPLPAVTEKAVDLEVVADALVARDYVEVITWSFVDDKSDELVSGESSDLRLTNPISSEMSVMRSSLWGGMLRVAAANAARQQERIRLFEIGKSYHGSIEKPVEIERVAGLVLGPALKEQWGSGRQTVDFFDIKGDVESLLIATGSALDFTFHASDHPALQPGQTACVHRDDRVVGIVGKLHPSVASAFDLKQDVFVFELDAARCFASRVPAAGAVSRFPQVRRDIAVVVRDEVRSADLVTAVAEAVPGLIREVRIFDVYRGDAIEAGLKSIALGLILQETSRTLTDDDADAAVAAAVKKIKQDFDADLRD